MIIRRFSSEYTARRPEPFDRGGEVIGELLRDPTQKPRLRTRIIGSDSIKGRIKSLPGPICLPFLGVPQLRTSPSGPAPWAREPKSREKKRSLNKKRKKIGGIHRRDVPLVVGGDISLASSRRGSSFSGVVVLCSNPLPGGWP